ncbi:hypothetical protein B0H15DRAFT_123640 [Mycena belliarum]|uniref:Uncharacterized protein n=1 Tax=Mycena belliarum TaxID=1033014 RepID=A0AAD6UE73_9AGAR|nr:hypothetical protein B0H15DRAFT_123640 [Mycena belliae]
MDIRIILNPGALGPPPKGKAQQQPQPSKKKPPRRGTPTVQSSAGSAIAVQRRRLSLRSASTGAPARKNPQANATPVKRHASLRHERASPPLRKARATKRERGLHGEDFKLDTPLISSRAAPRTGRHSSTRSSSAATSASRHSPSRASLLLSRAKERVALEVGARGHTGRTRSIMDVVMDLKGDAYEEDALLRIAEPRRDYYAFTSDGGGLAAYWADQAAIWAAGDASQGVPVLTRFPVSMERSTAGWECGISG